MKRALVLLSIVLQVQLLTMATSMKSPKQLVSINGRIYYFSTGIGANIAEAVSICKELGLTLAGLETQEEFDAVSDFIISYLGMSDEYFWTSGSLQHTIWVWSNSGEPFSFSKWAVGQPDNLGGDERNLCIKNGLMHDCTSGEYFRFICEDKPC